MGMDLKARFILSAHSVLSFVASDISADSQHVACLTCTYHMSVPRTLMAPATNEAILTLLPFLNERRLIYDTTTMFVCVCASDVRSTFQVLNQLTNVQEASRECYTTAGHPKLIPSNFLKSVIIWRMGALVR